VGTVLAVDADAPGSSNSLVRYRLKNATGGNIDMDDFGVDAKSGQIRIRTNARLDSAK
jgi:hypothetical protein